MPVAITSIGSTKDIAFFQNADFSRQSPVGANGNILNADGQIWMGMTTPDIYGSTIAVVNLSSKALTSLTGDSGTTVIGSAKIYGRTGSANSGSTVGFNGASANEMDLVVSDSNLNTIIGSFSGNNTITGSRNTCFGSQSFDVLSSGLQNTCVGSLALTALTQGQGNTFVGYGSGRLISTTNFNTGCGYQALSSLATGAFNLGLGSNAGASLNTSESSNICIVNSGIGGQSNSMFLGTQGSGSSQVNQTYIAGIVGVTVSNSQLVTINSSTGQMGVSTQGIAGWTDITTATQTMAIGNGYITNRGGGVTYTLPTTATEGDMMRISGKLGIWVIAQNANQQITVASSSTTVGVSGSVTATNVGDCIELLCTTGGASTIWRAQSLVGNLTIA